MDRDKLKLIVRNLELLVDSLKSEVYADNQKYSNFLVGFAPLKNEGSTKLWLTGEVTGGQLFGGIGLSYKFIK